MVYLRDATKYRRRHSTLKFIEEVHSCPAVWDVSSLAQKETKNKQRKMQVLGDKLGFVETFLFCHRFLFHFSSSVLLFYVNATALSRSAMWPITVCCKLLDSEGTSLLACEQPPNEVRGKGARTGGGGEGQNKFGERK